MTGVDVVRFAGLDPVMYPVMAQLFYGTDDNPWSVIRTNGAATVRATVGEEGATAELLLTVPELIEVLVSGVKIRELAGSDPTAVVTDLIGNVWRDGTLYMVVVFDGRRYAQPRAWTAVKNIRSDVLRMGHAGDRRRMKAAAKDLDQAHANDRFKPSQAIFDSGVSMKLLQALHLASIDCIRPDGTLDHLFGKRDAWTAGRFYSQLYTAGANQVCKDRWGVIKPDSPGSWANTVEYVEDESRDDHEDDMPGSSSGSSTAASAPASLPFYLRQWSDPTGTVASRRADLEAALEGLDNTARLAYLVKRASKACTEADIAEELGLTLDQARAALKRAERHLVRFRKRQAA